MRGYNVLLALLVYGVFSADAVEVPVMEGDSVTLNTNVTKKHDDIILWYFNDTLIAYINGNSSKNCLYDGEGGRFRDRLKVDYESGSLNITDIRSEHAGHYEAEHIRIESPGKKQKIENKKCDSTKITRKTSSSSTDMKTYRVTVSAADSGAAESQMDTKEIDKTVPGSALSSGAVAGIVVGGLLVFAAVPGLLV